MQLLLKKENCNNETLCDIQLRSLKSLIEQKFTEIWQKFWICHGRRFARKIFKNIELSRKYEAPSYQYPATPTLSKIKLIDRYLFYTT